MKLPEIIKACAKRNNESISEALIRLTLFTNSKNNYSFIIGPTDSKGEASITKNEIITSANRTLELAIMDYSIIEEHFTGEIKEKILTKADILYAIEVYEMYGEDNYPKNHIVKLNNALQASTEFKDIELNVTKIQT